MFRDSIETMTQAEIKQRMEAIARLPHLLLVPEEMRSDEAITNLVKRYNQLRMNENPLDLEEMRYLSNKFNYEVFLNRGKKVDRDFVFEVSRRKVPATTVVIETTRVEPVRIISTDDLVESFIDDYFRDNYGFENPATKEEDVPLAEEEDREFLSELNALDEEMLNLDKFIEEMEITRGR